MPTPLSLHRNPKGPGFERFRLVTVGVQASGAWRRCGRTKTPLHTCPGHLLHLPVSELQPFTIDP